MTIRDQLKARGLHAKKQLGQHWLVDEAVVTEIVTAADIAAPETVVEVGPGPGVLTTALAARANQVIAVELDSAVLPVLRAETAGLQNLEIIAADILKVNPQRFGDHYQVVANVPYYITSAILRHFLASTNPPRQMVVMLQQEVAERITAVPPRMSLLAVSVQLYGYPEIIAPVAARSFWPVPAVDSAVLKISRIGEPTADLLDGLDQRQFFKVVRAGFAAKRKQLHNSLAHHLGIPDDQIKQIMAEAGIDPARRAETVSIPEWVQLGHALHHR